MTPAPADIELDLLLEAIYLRYQHDFRSYARSSLRRRVTLARDHFGCTSLSALQERVLREPALFQELLGFLTVHVGDLFRDPSYFLALRERVVPLLATYPSLKIWVAGCSTGEEVLGLAILLREEGLLDRSTIYATDIDARALARAEAGIYPIERIATFSDNYRAAGGRGSLSEYYTTGYGAAVFDRSLRDRVVFSDHSLATDTVFSEVQFVSCRNVLIYFDEKLRDRAVGLFKDALPHGGFLGLGARETLRFSEHARAFTDFARAERIYRRTGR